MEDCYLFQLWLFFFGYWEKSGTKVVQGTFLQHLSAMLVWFQLNGLLISQNRCIRLSLVCEVVNFVHTSSHQNSLINWASILVLGLSYRGLFVWQLLLVDVHFYNHIVLAWISGHVSWLSIFYYAILSFLVTMLVVVSSCR